MLSLTVPIKIQNYMNMNIFNFILHQIYLMLLIWVQYNFNHTPPKSLENPYRWFCWGRQILAVYLVSNFLGQIINSTACRSVEVLSDFRYVSMVMVQLFNSIVCFAFVFFLGVKFASVRFVNHLLT